MGKIVPIEDRAVYRVAAYLTKKDHAALEKLAKRSGLSISAFVGSVIREYLAKQTRTSDKL